MCGILYYSEEKEGLVDYVKGLEKIVYRGPDSTELVKGNGVWGFHRLSIMDTSDSGMQPFTLGEDTLICNGEIYNFRALKSELEKKYKFKSGSDCEVLLPLYKEKGLELFRELDGEFAIVLYDADTKKVVAGRDPIGIRPLFYGYSKTSGKIAFASEVKALDEFCEEVGVFPPGHYYIDGKFVSYRDMSERKDYIVDSVEEITKNIREKLEAGIVKRLDSDVPVGFLLSGGLDSSLVCSVAAKSQETPIKTFAIGMEHDAIDLKYAKTVADYIKSDHTEVVIRKEDVLASLKEVVYTLETWDITTIRASMGMYLLCKYIKENTDLKVIQTGEISDEIFGYKYTDFAPTPEEFQKEAEKRLEELHMYDVLRADRCISGNSLEGRVPFGDLDFVDYVMRIHPKIKMNTYGQGKFLLRKAFDNGEYLPSEILFREKAAFSDAVGHSLVDILKEYAESQYTDKEYEEKRLKYKHGMPFTKESLLYRELFEEHYKGKSHLIKDFWMPNKAWEGCDVKDPSARVLSNYGESGK